MESKQINSANKPQTTKTAKFGQQSKKDLVEDFKFDADDVFIDAKKYKEFARKMHISAQNMKDVQTQAQLIQCLYEATEWLKEKIDAMELADKDVLIVIGASRTGKGTLLTALQGQEMKLFKKNDVADQQLKDQISGVTFMAPVGENGQPLQGQFMSYGHNSHTLKPKLVSDPPKWGDLYLGLDDWYAIDFPGMFESRGPEIEAAIMLGLQHILLSARKAKVVVLVSANIFNPDSNQMIATINQKLSVMFKEPEKHTIIGIVKTSFELESLGEEEDIMAYACGEEEEGEEKIQRSFKQWAKPFPEQDKSHIMIVEQTNTEQLSNLVMAVMELDCIKSYVKKGFLDEFELQKMFEQADTKEQLRSYNKYVYWTYYLTTALEDQIQKPNQNIEQIIVQIMDAIQLPNFTKETGNNILMNMKLLLIYQQKVSEMWNSIDNPYRFRTILGLFNEYQCVNKLLNEERHQNPAVTACLYQIDSETVYKVKNSLLIIKLTRLDATVFDWLESCKDFLSKEKYNSLKEHYERVKQQYVSEIQRLGQQIGARQLPEQETDTESGKVQQFFSNVFKIFKKKTDQQKEKEQNLQVFKKEMEIILYNYIKLDLDTTDNLLLATNKRQQRVNQIVKDQAKLKDQTQEDIDMQTNEFQQTLYQDQLGLKNDKELHDKLYGPNDQESEIVLSIMVNKTNKWEEQKKTILIISNFAQINLLSELKSKRYEVKINNLKSLTWIIDDLTQQSQEIAINSKSTSDYKIECNSKEEKQHIFQAMKYLYWKVYEINLPIYQIPKSQIQDYFNSKRVPFYQRVTIPEKFRVSAEDIYFEKVKDQKDLANDANAQQKQIDSTSQETQAINDYYLLLNGSPIDANDFNSKLNLQQQRVLCIENMDLRGKIDQDGQIIDSDSQDMSVSSIVQTDVSESQNQVIAGAPRPINQKKLKFISLIGRGSQGKVYLAQHEETKDYYAIKVLRKDHCIRDGIVSFAISEKKILKQVDHPFIINLQHSFQNQLKLYFVTPFIEGGNLFKHIKIKKRFGEDITKLYTLQVAMALTYLHQQGVLYRDLKLDNILIARDGYLKLVDFGIAKILEKNQRTQTFCGTMSYLAPEILMEQEYDFTVDWWALGILTYEMLFGFTPFQKNDASKQFEQIQKQEIKYDTEKLGIQISPEAIEFIKMCLEFDPKKRFGSDEGPKPLEHAWFSSINQEDLYNKTIVIGEEDRPKLDEQGPDLRYFEDVLQQVGAKETLIPISERKILKGKQDMFKEFDE